MLGILFGYIGTSVNNNQFKMSENLDYSQKLTTTILNKVESFYRQLQVLAYLSSLENTKKYEPVTANNITISNDSFTDKYLLQHSLTTNNISLYRSLYRNFTVMTEQGWSTTQKLAQIDSYILEFMFNYDDLSIFFSQYYLINQQDQILHYFPVVYEMNESYQSLKPIQQIIYNNDTIIFTYPFTYGLIAGVANTLQIGKTLSSLESSFMIKVFKTDNSFYVSNGQQMNLQCECQLKAILNISNECSIISGQSGYYSSNSCNSLYVKDISTDLNIQLYLVIYKQDIQNTFSIENLYTLAWPYYVITVMMLFVNILIIINRVNLFTRDITNPIKQVTYKIDKIINNIFQIRIINKIQADDILIKEETEVQTLLQEFSRLFDSLRNTNTFNIQTLEKKEKKDIQAKQNDKSIEQIKILSNKFRESL